MKAKLAEILAEDDPLKACRDQLQLVSDSLPQVKRLASLLERYSPPEQGPSGRPLVDTAALSVMLADVLERLTLTTKKLLDVVEARVQRPQ